MTNRKTTEQRAAEVAKGDAEYPTEAAETNENLILRTPEASAEEVKASIALNSPVGSHASYRDEKAEKKLAEKREKDAE